MNRQNSGLGALLIAALGAISNGGALEPCAVIDSKTACCFAEPHILFTSRAA